jgi:hypothetical protein
MATTDVSHMFEITNKQMLKLPLFNQLDKLYNEFKPLFDYESVEISCFGKVVFPIGTKLYHAPNGKDDTDDKFMCRRGSGFFAISTERYAGKGDYITYTVSKELILPTLFVEDSSNGKRYDLVPEFSALLCGKLSSSHFSARGQTSPMGCWARFQLTALNENCTYEKWKCDAIPLIELFQSKMKELKMIGWFGVDQNSNHEIFLICPIDAEFISII